jgi:hypothetical protein
MSKVFDDPITRALKARIERYRMRVRARRVVSLLAPRRAFYPVRVKKLRFVTRRFNRIRFKTPTRFFRDMWR